MAEPTSTWVVFLGPRELRDHPDVRQLIRDSAVGQHGITMSRTTHVTDPSGKNVRARVISGTGEVDEFVRHATAKLPQEARAGKGNWLAFRIDRLAEPFWDTEKLMDRIKSVLNGWKVPSSQAGDAIRVAEETATKAVRRGFRLVI